MVHNQYNSALLVIVFPCRQVSDSAAGSQVYLMSMNNVEDEPIKDYNTYINALLTISSMSTSLIAAWIKKQIK